MADRFVHDPEAPVLLVGGAGVVGRHVAALLRGAHPQLPLMLAGVSAGRAPLETVLRALSEAPRRILGLADTGDWIAIDRDAEWTVNALELGSKGKNTPLLGRRLTGRVVIAVVNGKVRYDAGASAAFA